MTYYEESPVSPGSKDFTYRELVPGDIVPLEYYRGTMDPKLGFVVEYPLFASNHALPEDVDRISLVRFARGNTAHRGVEKLLYRAEVNLLRRKTPEGARVVWKPTPKR